jgi:hypothetical protein
LVESELSQLRVEVSTAPSRHDCEFSALQSELATRVTEVEGLRARACSLAADLAAANSHASSLRESLGLLESACRTFQSAAGCLQSAVQSRDSEIAVLQRQLSDAAAQSAALEALFEDSKAQVAALTPDRSRLQQAVCDLEEQLAAVAQSCNTEPPTDGSALPLEEAADAPRRDETLLAIAPQASLSLAPTQRPSPPRDDAQTLRAYLKRTLLQFFLQDDSKREAMIPLLLELVGSNEKQIATVKRQWQRSRAFVTTSLFGFGK